MVLSLIAGGEEARAADCYIVGGLLVEPTYSTESSRLRLEAFIRSHRSEIRAVVVTHWHPDHCRALHAIMSELPFPVFGPSKVQLPFFLRSLPLETIREGDVILDRWHVLSAPGHDPNHVVFFDGETLIAGDALSSDLLVDYDAVALEATRVKIAALRPKQILQGHGGSMP
jgi:glyoxylase-like metal-dependent hydrolase (beta-lactamase superfamily II)